jgi:hypothetical protein
MAIKLLNEFYDYAKDVLDETDTAEHTLKETCQRYHIMLSDMLVY